MKIEVRKGKKRPFLSEPADPNLGIPRVGAQVGEQPHSEG